MGVVVASVMLNHSCLADGKQVIAHRGASGYLPEHTLASKALAYGMGADYLEQDVVLTRDDQPVVLHDIHLDTVTDVAKRFPTRARPDGRFYALDFTLDEIKSLRVTERVDLKTGQAVYPRRFPVGRSWFQIPTLMEEIELIQGLNHASRRNVGIYPEIKAPAWHRQQGKDISRIVLQVLHRYGYRSREDAVFVQCFDAAETRRLREELGCPLRLIQLIGKSEWREGDTDFDALRTVDGLRRIAEYADGIGPATEHVLLGFGPGGQARLSALVDEAHRLGLLVHPYTLRVDALPDGVADFEQLLGILFDDAHVDGAFTDFPDRMVAFLRERSTDK